MHALAGGMEFYDGGIGQKSASLFRPLRKVIDPVDHDGIGKGDAIPGGVGVREEQIARGDDGAGERPLANVVEDVEG